MAASTATLEMHKIFDLKIEELAGSVTKFILDFFSEKKNGNDHDEKIQNIYFSV